MQPFNLQKESNMFEAPTLVTPGTFSASSSVQGSTSEVVRFPDVDPNWYRNGLPEIITPPQEVYTGGLIDVFPIDLYAVNSGDYDFNTSPEYGYFIYNGQIVDGRISSTHFNAGQFMLTNMVNINDRPERFEGSKVTSNGYWKLLQDFGGIDAGSTASQQVSLTSGVSNTDSQSLSYAIGLTAGIKGTIEGIELSTQISTTLTQTFGKSVTISTQQTVSTTVDYQAQPKSQRIGVYQFYRNYTTDASDHTRSAFEDKVKYVQKRVATKTSSYPTNHFQKVFVLDPN